MLEFAHFILFFAVAVALIVIYIAAHLYKEFRFKYLRSNLFMLIGFSMITLSNSIETFLKIVIPGYYQSNVQEVFSDVVLFALPIIIIFASYHAVSLIWGLLNKKLSGIIKKASFFMISIFLLCQILFFIKPDLITNLQYLPSVIAHIILFAGIISSLFYLLFSVKKIKNRGRKKALNLFAIVLLTFIVSLFLIALIGGNNLINTNTQTIVLSALVFIFNLFIAIFIKQFFNKYHKDYILSNSSHLDELVDIYKITNREKEIVVLICKGKTNKEIATELFIAPLTARDHVSNIYKKVKVKNRVELTNMFKG